jgi:hypothetical protein
VKACCFGHGNESCDIAADFDPLEHIKHELRDIEVAIADLKEQSAFPGTQYPTSDGFSGGARRPSDLIGEWP